MKKQALMILGLVLLAGLAPVYAQSSAKASFSIPFEFVVGNVTLPAGDYIVEYSARTTMLSITSAEGSPTVFALTKNLSAKAAPARSKLLFNRYGAKNFLSQLWAANYSTGYRVPKTAYEREMMAVAPRSTAVQIAAK